MGGLPAICGAVAEWSKALAWKVSIRQNRIEGSNPSRSATLVFATVRTRSQIFDFSALTVTSDVFVVRGRSRAFAVRHGTSHGIAAAEHGIGGRVA